jgi:signal transduction histidine kinase
MKLHQFLSEHGDELFEICLRNLKRDVPDRSEDEVGEHLRPYIAEMARVLRRADGFTDEDAPDPPVGPADVGRDRRRRGFPIEHLVPTYAALSTAVGELGGRLHLAFGAEEYGVFNQVIDAHVAKAIEEFAEDAQCARDHALGERLGSLAHELRNALASASMAFGMLERGLIGIRGPTADVVRRNHRRMGALIEQTLVAARARSGGVRAELHEIRLSPLLREIEASAVFERGIRLALDADESLLVVADEHLLSSAISNLVQNAIKFSLDGVSIALRARAEGDAVTIEVEDGCGGLPAGKRDDLFQPFVQGSSDRRGMGLGLSITRDAVQAMAGEITVQDIPKKGCVFTVKLPRKRRLSRPPAP